jgi:hypothetical protein
MRPDGGGGGSGRPTDWDILGYGTDPVPGSPADIRAVATDWESVATSLSTAHTAVSKAHGDAEDKSKWQGDASATFLSDAQIVDDAYGHANTWYSEAHAALNTWATAVEHAQEKADKALAKANVAKNTRDTAQSTHDTAHNSLEWFKHQSDDVQKANKDEMDKLRTTISNSAQDVSDARAVISRQTTKAQNAKTGYDAAAKTAVEKLTGIAKKFNKVPTIPGTAPLTYDASASASAEFGTWKVWGGGTSGEHGSAGYTLTAGAGGFASSDASFKLGDGELDASASATAFVGGSVSAEGKAEFHYGALKGSAEGQVVAMVGLLATAKASMTYKDGKFDAQASASASAEAKATASGSAQVGVGPVSAKASGSGTAQAGAAASADAKLHVGKDGVSAKAGVDSYAGARAGADGSVDVGGVSAGGGVGVRAGVGFSASAGADLDLNDVGVSLKLGGALGIGADVSIDLHVHPADMVDDVKDIGGDAVNAVKKLKFW